MSQPEDIAAVVGAKYGPDADGEPADDSKALGCAGDAIRAVKAGDRGAFLEAVRAMLSDEYEDAGDEG